MKTVVICSHCGEKRVNLVSGLGKDDVYVVCAHCSRKLGEFSAYALKQEEKKNDAR